MNFEIIRDDIDLETGTRILREVRIMSVGPVMYPANPFCRIVSVKEIPNG